MALEDYARDTRALIKSLRAQADTLEKSLKDLLRLQSGSPVLDDGKLIRKPDAWNVADDIERILASGAKSMTKDELVKTLVDNDLVKGATRQIKISAARRAITVGHLKGYLRFKGETVHWVPGVYKNPRLQKNI